MPSDVCVFTCVCVCVCVCVLPGTGGAAESSAAGPAAASRDGPDPSSPPRTNSGSRAGLAGRHSGRCCRRAQCRRPGEQQNLTEVPSAQPQKAVCLCIVLLFVDRMVLLNMFLLQAGAIKNGTVGTVQTGVFCIPNINIYALSDARKHKYNQYLYNQRLTKPGHLLFPISNVICLWLLPVTVGGIVNTVAPQSPFQPNKRLPSPVIPGTLSVSPLWCSLTHPNTSNRITQDWLSPNGIIQFLKET